MASERSDITINLENLTPRGLFLMFVALQDSILQYPAEEEITTDELMKLQDEVGSKLVSLDPDYVTQRGDGTFHTEHEVSIVHNVLS